MSQVELTQLQWAGQNLRKAGPFTIQTEEVVAQAETGHYCVLYLRSGEKVMVRESLAEIERLSVLSQTQRDIEKRFKREMRQCKTMGVPVDEAFSALWEDVSSGVKLPEAEQAELYQHLLDWTKRWLK